jgi:hypothetical protein
MLDAPEGGRVVQVGEPASDPVARTVAREGVISVTMA